MYYTEWDYFISIASEYIEFGVIAALVIFVIVCLLRILYKAAFKKK